MFRHIVGIQMETNGAALIAVLDFIRLWNCIYGQTRKKIFWAPPRVVYWTVTRNLLCIRLTLHHTPNVLFLGLWRLSFGIIIWRFHFLVGSFVRICNNASDLNDRIPMITKQNNAKKLLHNVVSSYLGHVRGR